MSTQENQKDWFVDWFDARYYNMLYKERDAREAYLFVDAFLTRFPALKPENITPPRALDLACGSGRYARALIDAGYATDGVDLSENSIQEARRFVPEANFWVGDMRELDLRARYGIIFNMFTSFGYFENVEDNERILKGAYKALASNGVFVLDYLNPDYSLNRLKSEETIEKDGVRFEINRSATETHILKNILVYDGRNHYEYVERVQIFRLDDFKRMLGSNGFDLMEVWGDYAGNYFDPEQSERLIIIGQV